MPSDHKTTEPQSGEPTQEQVQAMVDVWREWSAQTPGLRDTSVNGMMRRAYIKAVGMKEPTHD